MPLLTLFIIGKSDEQQIVRAHKEKNISNENEMSITNKTVN
jgi:hypothetical protein